MRRPKIHLAFGDKNGSRGISTILINKHELKECIHKTNIESLDYLTAGPVPPNPSELLLTQGFQKILDELKKIYDVVILDTPPIGLVTDGVLVMKKADLPIYIVRADYSKKDFLKLMNRLIYVNGFTNLAVILNSVKTAQSYGYGYGKRQIKGYYVENVNGKPEEFLKPIKGIFKK